MLSHFSILCTVNNLAAVNIVRKASLASLYGGFGNMGVGGSADKITAAKLFHEFCILTRNYGTQYPYFSTASY